MTTNTITVIVPSSITIENNTLHTILNAVTPDTVTLDFYQTEQPSTNWAFDTTCPHCSSDDIRVVRGREEEYQAMNDNFVYNGISADTVVFQTEALLAFCGSCDTTLYEHPAYTTLRTDTL